MVRAWIMDDLRDVDQRMPHMTDPVRMVNLQELSNSGVLYYKFDTDDWENNAKLTELRNHRGYTYKDELLLQAGVLSECDYQDKLKMFYTEHLHDDEEIRFVIDGSGYFDFRNHDNEWIRIEVIKGDLIILPSGLYHRFTLDTKDYIRAVRLFVGEPVWIAHNRPEADTRSSRDKYLKSSMTGHFI